MVSPAAGAAEGGCRLRAAAGQVAKIRTVAGSGCLSSSTKGG